LLGGIPSIIPDIPINVIFLILFLVTGIGHVIVVYINLIKGKKFVISFVVARKSTSQCRKLPKLIVGQVFCLTRVIATSLRMAWACHSTNLHLDIAAMVFLYAGIVMLYLINLILAQRILRAQHPQFGWAKPVAFAFLLVFAITIVTLVCVIAGVITSFYSRSAFGTNAARELQRFGSTTLAMVSMLPLIILGISSLLRRHPHIRMTKTTDKFGEGSMRGKVTIVLISSTLLSVSAWFRAGAVLGGQVPLQGPGSQPTGYLSKACFYVLIFTIEIIVCILWLFTRIDKRFHIPDGAQGPFSYANGFVFAGEPGNEKKRVSAAVSATSDTSRPVSNRLVASKHTSASEGNDPISPLSKRSSWAASIASKEQEKQARIEGRVSWGGVAREDVLDTKDEEGKVLRYQPFAKDWVGGDTAADVGVEGIEKELGFDPDTGRWAVRPVSSGNSVRLSKSRSVLYES
jgi:hypothetical protein